MWTERGLLPVNVRSRRRNHCLLPIVVRDQVCAPGYQGRKRGEVVRTRTVLLQAHTHQFLGTFGGPGNGDYRGELLRAIAVITSYATKRVLPPASVLLRLDGLYGDAAPLIDVLTAGLGVLARSRDYHLLDLEEVQRALARSPDQVSTHPESGVTRALYDCPDVPLTPAGPQVRLVVATHAVTSSPPKIGVERDGTVYELFVSTLPAPAFTCSDVLDLYLHRGSFETVLADEDVEQNADRWYSHTPCGQEFCQILAQWVWNLRLELGQKLSSSELRTSEFAKARTAEPAQGSSPAALAQPTPPMTYGPPQWARPSFTGGFPGSAFTLQPDGTLRCPADRPLYPQERRPERDGSLRVLYAARISHCRSCQMPGAVSREQHHDQASAGQCGVVAARFLPLGFLSHAFRNIPTTASCSSRVERLAPLSHPAGMAQTAS
jgi:hypothetical protein